MPQGIEIKTLDDLPGFGQQADMAGMKISPLTAPLGEPIPLDPTELTPTWDVNELTQGGIGALQNVMAAQRESADAATFAVAANKMVQQQVFDTTTQQQEKVLGAVQKLQRIERNPLASLFALFDPRTWSKQHQLLEIEEANLRTQSTTLRGQAIMNINNQLPAIRQAEVELAQQAFQNTKDVFGLIKSGVELDSAQWDRRLKATTLRMTLTDEQRKLRDDALKGMTVEQAKATLKQAQAGKGDWVGMQGLLEDKIDRDEKADLDIKVIKQNLAAGEFDLAQKRMNNLVSGIEYSEGLALINQALSSGSPTITYRGVKIPLGIAINGVEQSRVASEALTKASQANTLYAMNEKLQKLVTQNSALALTNPQAANNLKAIAQFRDPSKGGQLNPQSLIDAFGNTPNATQQFNRFLDYIGDQTKTALELGKSTYTTPGAKAAYDSFIQNGQPDVGSAHFVVEDALAQPGISVKGKFAPVWDILRKDYASRVQQLNPANMPAFNLTSNQGIGQFLMWQRQNQNKDLADIRAEVVQGGQFNDQLHDEVDNIFQMDAVKNALTVLSQAAGPGATVYANLARDPRRMVDSQGKIDPKKIATYLAQQNVLNGNRADYLATFNDALRTYATQADSVTADPSMTVEDQHLLTSLYGPNPFGTIMSGFISFMVDEAQIQRDNMDEAIRQDVTGETQRRALANISSDIDPASRGVILQSVPSATGIGTAEEMKAIHGTDPRYGSTIPQGGNRRR